MGVAGVGPRLGQTFTADQTLPHAAPVVVLSSEIWQSAFGGQPSIVGQQVEINGRKTALVALALGKRTHIFTFPPFDLTPMKDGFGWTYWQISYH